MTRLTVELPDFTSPGGMAARIRFQDTTNGLIDATALRIITGDAIVTRMQINGDQDRCLMQIVAALGDPPGDVNPSLSGVWEQYNPAITLQATGLTDLEISGPVATGSDSTDTTEPYSWLPGSLITYTGGLTQWVSDFKAAYALDTTLRATMVLDDGVAGAPTVALEVRTSGVTVTMAAEAVLNVPVALEVRTSGVTVTMAAEAVTPTIPTIPVTPPPVTPVTPPIVVREFDSILADPYSTDAELAMEYWAALPFSQIDVAAYRDILNPFRCPLPFLSELADLLQAYTWAPFMPEAYQRQAVADWWYYYRYRTTEAALQRWMTEIESLYSLRWVESGSPLRKTELTVNMSDTPLVAVNTDVRQWEIDTVRRILGWPFMIDPINVTFSRIYRSTVFIGMGMTIKHFKGW